MQRLTYLYIGTSRFFRVVNTSNVKNCKLVFEKENSFYDKNNFIFNRCLSTKNNDSKGDNGPDVHAKLYKPSTATEKTHVPDDLKGGQPPETFDTNASAAAIGDGKVWSAQNLGSVHVAPLGRVAATTFTPTPTENDQKVHEATVYTTQGEVNVANPFKTRPLQPEVTPGQLAEAAAASAFEPFAPDTPLASTPAAEAVFAPKISSSDVYSTASSPTAHFDTVVPPTNQEAVKYETAKKIESIRGTRYISINKKTSKRKSI